MYAVIDDNGYHSSPERREESGFLRNSLFLDLIIASQSVLLCSMVLDELLVRGRIRFIKDQIDMYSTQPATMSKKTVTNDAYKGLVEAMAIPAEIHDAEGGPYASFGSTVPIHRCSPEQIKEYAPKTHHYCGIFSEQLLAPLGELAYVRVDENTAEKVFINRSKRILLTSSDGVLAQWRCAPTFESANHYIAGAPILNASGDLVSVVTVKRGNHYAVSNFEGDGGYFATPLPWKVLSPSPGCCIYGDKHFSTREELRTYISTLPPVQVDSSSPPTPVLHIGGVTRVVLVGENGTQVSHNYVQGAISNDVTYL